MRNARTILKVLGWIWLVLVLPFAWISIQVIEQLPRKGFPQNLYDSTLTTAKYLCDGGLDMRNLAHSTKAIHRYNNSMAYVANVLAWSTAYSTGIDPSPADLPRIH